MKKIILTLVMLTIVSTTQIFGQSKAKESAEMVSFCEKTGDATLVCAALGKCDEITATNKEVKIKSFNMSWQLPASKSEKEGLWIESSNMGGKISAENMAKLKTLEALKVTKLLIENVIATDADGKNERKISGMVITLK
ncbi:MAG: hypothetical protein NTX97_11870 [Bacteroidetes bacterium]|nr:hypothetical protein [Bacteroidota bacterium]